jgi:Leucine-rich repeat (LRR) protein
MHPKLLHLLEEINAGRDVIDVDLSGCELMDFPLEIFKVKRSVQKINMGNNNLSSLPEEFCEFENLSVLFFASNKFKRIPLCLGKLTSLFMLSFKSNQLEYIDDDAISPSIEWLILTDNNLGGCWFPSAYIVL